MPKLETTEKVPTMSSKKVIYVWNTKWNQERRTDLQEIWEITENAEDGAEIKRKVAEISSKNLFV